jgi:hypothetical protein
MILLEVDRTYDCSDPELVFYATADGWLTDLYSLQYQIFDVSTPAKAAAPSQIYPAVAGNKATVDVGNDCPTGGKLGTGRYAATWTVDALEPTGMHEIRWFWQWSATGDVYSGAEPVEVLTKVPATLGQRLYASVADVRDEGIAASVTDIRVLRSLLLASRAIDRFTGRTFGPRYQTARYDGRGTRGIMLQEPVIGLDEIRILTNELADVLTTITPDDSDAYKVYNRHLGGLTDPDDRVDPRVELSFGEYSVQSISSFYPGAQNLELDGVYGYTDPHKLPWGQIPELIRYATVLIALQRFEQAYSSSGGSASLSGRIIEERTRDQSYKLAPLTSANSGGGNWGTAFTGDPVIDQILGGFVRPMKLGAV